MASSGASGAAPAQALDDAAQIAVADDLAVLTERNDGAVDLVDFARGDVQAERVAAPLNRVPAGMPAEHQLLGLLADVLRPHDLVRARVLQDAVLVNAGFVGERVASDDGLVGLHGLVGEPREQLARLEEPGRLDPGLERQPILPHAHRHHDLFERRVAGPLADAVDGAPRPGGRPR